MSVMLPETGGTLGRLPSCPLATVPTDMYASCSTFQPDTDLTITRSFMEFDNMWASKHRGRSFSTLNEAQTGYTILRSMHDIYEPQPSCSSGPVSWLKGTVRRQKSATKSCLQPCACAGSPSMKRKKSRRKDKEDPLYCSRQQGICMEEIKYAHHVTTLTQQLSQSRLNSFQEKTVSVRDHIDRTFGEIWVDPSKRESGSSNYSQESSDPSSSEAAKEWHLRPSRHRLISSSDLRSILKTSELNRVFPSKEGSCASSDLQCPSSSVSSIC